MKHLSIQFSYISTWKVFFYQKYIYYEKSDRFPWNGGNQCGSTPVIITFFHLFVASLLGTPNALQIRIPNYELVFLALHFQFMCVPTALAYLNKKKRFSLYYLSRDVSMKKYLYETENTCRYFQYSLEVIPYFIYSNFFVVNADYFFYWSLFHERLSTIATSISHEPLAVHCMIYINCCVTLSSKE